MKKNISKNDQRLTINDQRLTINIDHVAGLANLSLSPAEKQTFEKQLGKVLNYFNKLNEIDTKSIDPIGQITGLVNITREDEAAPSLSQEEALTNAPRTYNGFFEVDAVFDQND